VETEVSFEKIDSLDRKILHQLDLNSRRHVSDIAKAVRSSRHVVDYRIKKLLNDGYAKSFSAFIDPTRFGLTSWKVYLQLKGTNSTIEKEMVSFLESLSNVWWVVKCAGAYDLLYSVLAKDSYELNKVLYEFHDKFGQFIHKEDLNNHLEPVYFSRGFLSENKPVELCEPFMKKPVKENFDETDIKIMKLIGKNARLTSVEISQEINSTPRTVNYRIKQLKEKKAIVFYRFGIDPAKFNLEFYKGLIYLSSTKEEDINSLREYCRVNPFINECVKSVGPWQFEMELEIPNFRKFAEIALDMKTKFPELINRIEPLLLFEEKKSEFNFLDYFGGK
jgi:DNA-binding Lrp family transcriptional regulator